ncbi:MAG TPA: hypothetical protein VH986_03690 [Acidimicrobiia bacterium]
MSTPRTCRAFVASIASLAAAATALVVVGASPAAAASSNNFNVKASEYVFKTSGKPVAGNVQITFSNVGTELHMFALGEINPGVTAKQVEAAATSPDQQTAFAAISPPDAPQTIDGTPGVISPGEKSVNIANLAAGHYAIMCFVPAPDGTPHIMHGMVKTFDVAKGKSSLKLPKDGVTNVTITDAAITLPSSGLPKNGWVKVTNNSAADRDFTLARLDPGVTVDQAEQEFGNFFNTGQFPDNKPPASLAAGTGSVSAGKTAYVQVSLKAGDWAAVSSDQNSQDNTGELQATFTVK